MPFATAYSYDDRHIFDFKKVLKAIKFIIINLILVCIFFFLALEEIDWSIFSYRENIKDKVFDETSWNINKLN